MATPILLGIVWSGDKDDGGDTTADVPAAAAAPPAEPKAGLKRARPADTAAPGAATGDGGLQWRAAADICLRRWPPAGWPRPMTAAY